MSKRMMVVGMMVFAALSAKGQLANPSFETQGTQTDLADGWSRWGDWINRETGWTPVKDGTCIIGYHHWQIEKSDNSGLWQDVKVTPGQKYTFSVFANADKPTDEKPSADTVELRLETTVNGQQSTVASKTFKVADLLGGEEWSQLQVSGVAPNDTLRVLIVVNPASTGPRGGAVKFDLAALTTGDQPAVAPAAAGGAAGN